ncbi:MAG: helix-turn-helix transcriptional regulator [Oscillibacter sp.]|nr:helix-turn-helix transcriptional regulator [Oscillibacter sp.]
MRQAEQREIIPVAPDGAVRELLALSAALILPLAGGALFQEAAVPDSFSVIAAVEGSLTLSSGQRYALLEPGQAAAFGPGLPCELRAVTDCLCMLVRLQGDAAVRLLEPGVFVRGAAPVREAVLALALLDDERPPVPGEIASARAYSMLLKLRGSRTAPEAPALVEAAIAIIQAEFPFLEGLDELAERLEVSKAHLSRSFSQKIGISPGRYITQVKIAYAKLLLQDEDASITYAAEASGFANANYFAKVFRRETGMSPSEYLETVPRRKNPPIPSGPALW